MPAAPTPPCRRARSVQATSCGIADLPDDVLTTVLQHLSQTERLQHTALVDRRFCRLSCSPKLVHKTVVIIQGGSGGGSDTLAKARALLGWLARHGKHIGKLRITLTPGEGCSTAEEEETAALVAACLTACGGPSGQLEDLWVGDDTPLVPTAWLLAMSKLKVAVIGSADTAITLPDGLHMMTALHSLSLYGHPLQLPPQLPPCLTELTIEDGGSPEMPPQIAQLSNLLFLTLRECTYSKGSMGGLTQLAPTLKMLKLKECTKVPPALSALTGLQRLLLCETPQGGATAADELDASLQQLQLLTALALLNDNTIGLPPGIGSLPCLARFAYDCLCQGPPPQLPAGEWLHSLQELYASSDILAKSVTVLAEASQLNSVCMVDTPGDCESVTASKWDAFYTWAASHKPLHYFTFDFVNCDDDADEDAPFTRDLFDDIMWLHAARPELVVYRFSSPQHPEDFLEGF